MELGSLFGRAAHHGVRKYLAVGVLALTALSFFAGLATPPAFAQLKPCGRQVVISPTLPKDECGGAFKNSQDQAALFAWNAFIALNWPALANEREKPDTSKPFGASISPLVWETMRNKVEIYPGNGKQTVGPHGAILATQPPFKPTNPPDFGYDQASDYIYSPGDVGTGDGRVAACAGQVAPTQPAWITLDETTQIGVNQTYAGVVPAGASNSTNSAPQLIRYMVKANRALYQNIVGNQLWYASNGSPLKTAIGNFRQALAKGQTDDPVPPFVEFPPQTPPPPDVAANAIELKAAWRPLTAAEKASGRFHSATVRYYELTGAGTPCYREEVWGLIGLHVIQKTPTAPWFIWATFEQADNILDRSGKPVENADGKVVDPQSSPTTPALKLVPPASPDQDPTVAFADPHASYCTDPGSRLFFRENPLETNLPTGGNICVNQRWHDISSNIVAINASAHQTIKDYLAKQGISGSPWLYYKLVNVQPVPFDQSEIQPEPGSGTDPATYYTANAVIETDYTLGNYIGKLADSGVPTTSFENIVFLPFQGSGAFPKPLIMGGCTGCHAGAALRGTDFSFSLSQSSVRAPEPPNAFEPQMSLRRDLSLFAPVRGVPLNVNRR